MKSGESSEKSLKKTLNGFSLVALGIGAVVGAGIFSITGIVAGEHAGPAVTISFIIAAIAVSLVAICYTELSTMIPVSGSVYSYTYATIGEFMAWLIGWDLVLEYALAGSFVSVSWSEHLMFLLNDFGITIPKIFTTSTISGFDQGIFSIDLPAVIIVCILSFVLMRGISESAKINNILVIIKLIVILIFIVIGFQYINPANYTPYIPKYDPQTGRYGWQGVIAGASIVFIAFVGFDAIATAAQEVKNPKKNIPIGIFGSLIACTLIYVIFCYVMTGLLPYKEFIDNANPTVTAFKQTGLTSLNIFLNISIIIGLTSVILVCLLAQSRIFYTMGIDGLLPKMFSELHPKYLTPWKSNLFFMVFISIIAGVVPIGELAQMISLGTLLSFMVVCICVVIARKNFPKLERPFKVPFSPFVPLLGAGICIYLSLNLGIVTWIIACIWLIIGAVLYLLYGRKNSKLNK